MKALSSDWRSSAATTRHASPSSPWVDFAPTSRGATRTPMRPALTATAAGPAAAPTGATTASPDNRSRDRRARPDLHTTRQRRDSRFGSSLMRAALVLTQFEHRMVWR